MRNAYIRTVSLSDREYGTIRDFIVSNLIRQFSPYKDFICKSNVTGYFICKYTVFKRPTHRSPISNDEFYVPLLLDDGLIYISIKMRH